MWLYALSLVTLHFIVIDTCTEASMLANTYTVYLLNKVRIKLHFCVVAH